MSDAKKRQRGGQIKERLERDGPRNDAGGAGPSRSKTELLGTKGRNSKGEPIPQKN